MENQTDLEIGIGDKEVVTLQPQKVQIQEAKVSEVGEKKHKIIVLICKHPEQEEPIKISKVKYVKGDKVNLSSLWLTKDSDGKIQKDSPLAILLGFAKANNIKDLQGKEFDTVRESKDSGYLALKVY